MRTALALLVLSGCAGTNPTLPDGGACSAVCGQYQNDIACGGKCCPRERFFLDYCYATSEHPCELDDGGFSYEKAAGTACNFQCCVVCGQGQLACDGACIPAGEKCSVGPGCACQR